MTKKIFLSLMAVLGLFLSAHAQEREITGSVKDHAGAGIVGATILVEGTTKGTTSGADGSFSIKAAPDNVLVVSFMGYQSHTIKVGTQTRIDVVLKENTQAIDDVIVVAFGTAKKEAFTGSATVIKSDDIAKSQQSNVAQALAGKVAGVQLTNTSGQPGESPTIRIRGFSSLNAGNDPLWIVDGMPYSGDLNNLNPSDIESMTVLKDAASNSLYGARGANGVVMITTKKAKSQEAHVTIDAKWGVNSRAVQDYAYITNPAQFYELHYSALKNYYVNSGMSVGEAHLRANTNLTANANDGGLGYMVYTVPSGQEFIGINGKVNPAATLGRRLVYEGKEYYIRPDDWTDAAFRSSLRQEYNASISGQTGNASIYGSFGYLNNEGIAYNSDMDRYTARLRVDYQAKKWLKFSANANYTHFRYNQIDDSGAGNSSGNVFAYTTAVGPIYPLYIRDGEGNVMYNEDGIKLYDYGNGDNAGMERSLFPNSNALSDSRLNKQEAEGNAFNGTGYIDVTFLKDFKFTFNAGVSLDETRSTSVTNPWFGQFASEKGMVSKGHQRNFDLNLQQILNYTKQIGSHNINVMLGHESYQNRIYTLSATKSNMLTQENDELAGAIIDKQGAGSYRVEYNNEGYFARVMYDYAGKYFASASYRRDASSRFHPDHRWGNFWSLGAAWIINRESWFNASWVNMLKVKASYGSQGNDNLGSKAESYYRYTDYREILSSGDGVTSVLYQKGNPDITWETNANLNVGVEFGLWDNRLSGSIDVFNRKTTDMLFELATPIESGYTTIFTNIGDMVNRGLEIELNADLIRTKNLVWDFSLNMTHYKNKVTHLPEQFKNNTTADGKHVGRWQDTKFLTEGESVFSFYVPTYAGVDPETGKSLWYTYKTDDAGNKERIKTSDYSVASQEGREMHGDALPDVYGGFGTSLRFYGVDFSIGFTYQLGGQVLDQGYRFYMNSPAGTSTGNNYHHDLLNSWTPENSGSNIPRFAYNDSNQAAVSDRFLTSASYLNIQNITLGYTLPKRITRKFLVENLRIYLACDNVWYWSKRQGLDPRQSINGITNPYYYAPIRTFSGGVTVTF